MIDVAIEVFLIVALSATVSAIALYTLFPWALRRFDPQAVTLAIIGNHMSTVVEGQVFAFTVVAKNAAGVVVPDSGIHVTSGNATVGPDGSAGAFSSTSVGANTLTVSDGRLTATLAVTVTPDLTPATLEIVAA